MSYSHNQNSFLRLKIEPKMVFSTTFVVFLNFFLILPCTGDYYLWGQRKPVILHLSSFFVTFQDSPNFKNIREQYGEIISIFRKKKDLTPEEDFGPWEIKEIRNRGLNSHFLRAFFICDMLVTPFQRQKPIGWYLEKAEEAIEEAICLEPKVACFHYLKGVIQFNQAEPEGWYYIEKVKIPGITDSGLEKFCLSIRQRALNSFSNSFQIDPNLFEAFRAKAGVYERIGSDSLALENYNICLYKHPFIVDVYLERANVLKNLGREAEAKMNEFLCSFFSRLHSGQTIFSVWLHNIIINFFFPTQTPRINEILLQRQDHFDRQFKRNLPFER